MSKIMFVMPPMEGTTGIRLPLGIAYLSAVCKNAGHEAKCLDLSVGEKDLIKELELFNPDYVGFTCTTPTIQQAWRLCDEVKSWNKNVKTIVGGPHPTALPDESISKDQVDYVIMHDGEANILHLLNSNPPVKSIIDIQEKINLDDLPLPDWSDFDVDKYWTVLYKGRIMPIMTSRGCPWNCIYCFKSLFGRTMRFRSPENVIAELKWLKRKYNPRVIEIIDDLFTVNRKRTLEICQMIIDEGLDLKISTPNGIRVDTVDREVLLKMKEAGFFLVAFGLESGSQDILNKIGKGTTIDQGREAVRIAKEVGFEVMPSYQIGLPFDTPVTIDETINFAISNDTSYAQFFITTPYPGTRVRDYVLANGGTILVNDWSQYGHAQGKVFFEMPNLKKETVLKHYSKAYRKFYMRPKYIWRKAKDIRRLPQNFGMLFKYIGNFFGGADR